MSFVRFGWSKFIKSIAIINDISKYRMKTERKKKH